MEQQSPSLGNFDTLSTQYSLSRRGFDERALSFLNREVAGLAGKEVLDVGCGTGISTRQVSAAGALVCGSDLSEAMIREARAHTDGIAYTVAAADALSYTDDRFDLVTAFSAFHWFSDETSVQEIRRVLKSGGAFAAINKHDVAGIRREVVPLFKKYAAQSAGKDAYDPATILERYGFQPITSVTIPSEETYSYEDALSYLQSIALWNLVSEEHRPQLLADICDLCERMLARDGALTRVLETTVVLGWEQK